MRTPGAYRVAEAGPRVCQANMAKRRPSVKNFSYADDLLDELEASLSRERLGTYLDAWG